MGDILILKLGGSIVTDKSCTDYTIQSDRLHAVFAEIKRQTSGKLLNLIIVHGAGGHIHFLAHKYKLRSGTQYDSAKTQQALEVQQINMRLHGDILAIAKSHELSVRSFPTHEHAQSTSGKLTELSIDEITASLKKQEIPVLYGDMVPDETLGLSICSGDQVIAKLAAELPVIKIFFASDIDGVFTNDPHTDLEAELIEAISLSNLETKKITLSDSHNTDTTGGLRGKIQACEDLFTQSKTLKGIEIFNGSITENYRNIFTETSFPHSVITK